ncbi:biopolymer transporter ExbD [uncultured Cohaesibacter sp.]|uniref:ExbD/TolR family protein n=1 Tax=uncultured Cohaesibacter sp. TaxID=1002546 RepID=UPI0029C9670E|nr:biopolymer transporter ExbD [uncultured Cohaesibacter sp.]
MRLESHRRRRLPVGLTSLIDVIFLLLLFFMLSSTFSRYSRLDLGVAAAGTEGGERPRLLIVVSDEVALRLNGRPVAMDELAVAVQPLLDQDVRQAVVMPRGDVALQRLVGVLEALRQSGLETISLAD